MNNIALLRAHTQPRLRGALRRLLCRLFAKKRRQAPFRLTLLENGHVALADELAFERQEMLADALLLAKSVERMNEAMWNNRRL